MKNIFQTVTNAVPISKHFRCDGSNMKLIIQKGLIAQVEKSKPTGAESHEVIILQKLPELIIYGKSYPAREAIPSESWAERGRTYRDRGVAEKMRSALLQDASYLSKGLAATASEPLKPTAPPSPVVVARFSQTFSRCSLLAVPISLAVARAQLPRDDHATD